jgi:hypothetical protein
MRDLLALPVVENKANFPRVRPESDNACPSGLTGQAGAVYCRHDSVGSL